MEPPAQVGVEEAVAALRSLVGRHETLRTSFRFPAPVPTYLMRQGMVRQHVSDVGEFSVEVEDAAADDLDALAQRTQRRICAVPFDIRLSVAMRVVLLCRGGNVRRVVFGVSHQAVDQWGVGILRDELRRLTGPTAGDHLPAARQPVDQAAVEGTARYRERSRKGTRYLRDVLGGTPAARALPDAAAGAGARSAGGEGAGSRITSAAVSESVRRISSALEITPSLCLMGCVALLVAFHQQSAGTLLKTTYARRHSFGSDAYVAPHCLNALVPFSVDASQSVREYFATGYRAALAAFRMTDYDPDELGRIEGSVPGGTDRDGFCYFNYLPVAGESRAIAVRSGSDPGALAVTTRVSADRPVLLPARTLAQVVCRAVGPAEAVIQVNAVDGLVPGGPSAFLRRLESLMVRACDVTARVADVLAGIRR
ncbi:condensation domain-containing protein [Streptomyces sp. NBC_01477]|uniref:condensation domain-containing protein n=1 Tax=Streptomyces sp. NBC_01477 TaxID=2976015 RepID=UPI002E36CB92|nr:condensation domain-containing protein [Streptomyces sp. NBC_01477]